MIVNYYGGTRVDRCSDGKESRMKIGRIKGGSRWLRWKGGDAERGTQLHEKREPGWGQTGKASWRQPRPSLWFSTRGSSPQGTLCNTWDPSGCHSWRCYWHLDSDRDAAQHLLMPRAATNHRKWSAPNVPDAEVGKPFCSGTCGQGLSTGGFDLWVLGGDWPMYEFL